MTQFLSREMGFIMKKFQFQLSSAKKEIDQLDQDMQKKIKSLENIVRYCETYIS